MKNKMIMVALVAIVGISILGSAQAHVQVGNNSSDYCIDMDSPQGVNHLHAPGGATDKCTPPPFLPDLTWPSA